jgi:cytochrome oxidase Cu insertion factor (SCO1/SenC/PrrC family)
VSVEALSAGRIEGARRPWRDPFVIAFAIGALVLTVFPFIQRLALRAPPPLEPLGAWSLTELDGGAVVGDEALRGKVWLASFVPATCDTECQASLARFAGAARHLDDLRDKVALVTVARPDAAAQLRAAPAVEGARWLRLTGEPAALDALWARFAAGWNKQTRSVSDRTIEFLARPTFAVVDQDGAVRGFWPADDEGRGHAINAARMFARHGTEP